MEMDSNEASMEKKHAFGTYQDNGYITLPSCSALWIISAEKVSCEDRFERFRDSDEEGRRPITTSRDTNGKRYGDAVVAGDQM